MVQRVASHSQKANSIRLQVSESLLEENRIRLNLFSLNIFINSLSLLASLFGAFQV